MANTSEFFENLGKTFSRTADKVVKKTDEFINVQKIKSKRNTLENQMNTAYRNIGKQIFREYSSGSPVSEDIAKICEKIKKLQKEIDACTSEIADLKGVTVCDTCGSPIPDEADYCGHCGNPKPEGDHVEDAEFEHVEPEEFDFDWDDEDEEEEQAAEEKMDKAEDDVSAGSADEELNSEKEEDAEDITEAGTSETEEEEKTEE
ncbi:MAG: zinc ribbon domain-containing protein [Lachnospiraceae bacterium]|nr:zinc ribbon domain-containing protein [Lachnospiraceae bacterium]